MSVLEALKENALKSKKHIVLPEGDDSRVIKAAIMLTDGNYADITLLGDVDVVKNLLKEHGAKSDINVIDPKKSDKIKEYAEMYYEKRKHKGMTIEKAEAEAVDCLMYGAMMVESGDADGCVVGAVYSSGSVLSAGLRVIGTQKGVKVVSSVMIVETERKEFGEDGVLFFADVAVNPAPDANTLAEIAIASSDTWAGFMSTPPRVALLSFSTKGSAKTPSTENVVEAYELIKERRPDMNVDGELQLDAALINTVAERKAPGSKVAGKANVLVFPNLEAGNIGYKLVERFSEGAVATGPILQGINKPFNDLSRGSDYLDIYNTVLATIYQAKII